MDKKIEMSGFDANIKVLKQINCCKLMFAFKTDTLNSMFTVKATFLKQFKITIQASTKQTKKKDLIFFKSSPETFEETFLPPRLRVEQLQHQTANTQRLRSATPRHTEHILCKNSKSMKQYVKPTPKELCACGRV